MSPFDVSDALAREAVVFGAIVGALLIASIAFLLLRTRRLPDCWKCGFHSVRRSRSHRSLDALAGICHLRPYRCEKCLERFYCFGSRFSPGRSSSRTMAAGKREVLQLRAAARDLTDDGILRSLNRL
jgi:hypothetical protein